MFIDCRCYSKDSSGISSVICQRAPNPPESAQPRLSRVKRRSSPAGCKFGCVCSYIAGHEDAGVVTSHIGTNTPKFVPPRWGRPRFDPTQTGLCKFGWVWSSLNLCYPVRRKLENAVAVFGLISALGKWGRTQWVRRIQPDSSTVGVHLLPPKTHAFKGFSTRFLS